MTIGTVDRRSEMSNAAFQIAIRMSERVNYASRTATKEFLSKLPSVPDLTRDEQLIVLQWTFMKLRDQLPAEVGQILWFAIKHHYDNKWHDE